MEIIILRLYFIPMPEDVQAMGHFLLMRLRNTVRCTDQKVPDPTGSGPFWSDPGILKNDTFLTLLCLKRIMNTCMLTCFPYI
jgi:hypothetical protein